MLYLTSSLDVKWNWTVFVTVTHHEQPVSNLQPSVLLCCSAIDDFRDIYAVVTRDVLVPNSTSDAEAKTCVWIQTVDQHRRSCFDRKGGAKRPIQISDILQIFNGPAAAAAAASSEIKCI